MVLILISCGTVLIDQLTKIYIRKSLNIGESVPVIDNIFHITRVQNRGAAFGLMPNQHLILFFVALFMVITVAVFYFVKRPKGTLIKLALGFVLGGAIGNLLDRLIIGTITDFFDFRVWPVFNVADSAIVVGTLILLWIIKTSGKSKDLSAKNSKMGK